MESRIGNGLWSQSEKFQWVQARLRQLDASWWWLYYWQFCNFFGAASNYNLKRDPKLWSLFLNLEKSGCIKGSSGLETSPRKACEGKNTVSPLLTVHLSSSVQHRTWDRANQVIVPIAAWGVFTSLLSLSGYHLFLFFIYLLLPFFSNWSRVNLRCVSFRCKAKWFTKYIFFYRFFSIIGYYKILNIVPLPFFSFLILTSKNKPTPVPPNLFILISLLF